MAFVLQQVVIPVSVLGEQPDPPNFDAWCDYFALQLSTMRAAGHPTRCNVYLGEEVLAKVFDPVPETTPSDLLVGPLAELGNDRMNAKIYLDRTLPANTVRLE